MVEAAPERGGADEVFVSIDGGPEIDVSENRETGTDSYTLDWDTTTHENGAVPARLDARFLDHGGYETEAREIEVEVDDRPDPTVEITDPEPNEQIVGPHRIWVEADPGVDHEGLRVEVAVNEGAWENVTGNREGEDRHYYDWHGQTATHRTAIQARTVDRGGRALDAVQVNVTSVGTALAVAEPYEKMVWGCIDKLSPLSPSVNPSCNL